MNKKWQDMFDKVKNDSEYQKIKDDCSEFLQSMKNDGEEFNRQQSAKIERYLNQLAAGEITEEECKGSLQDMATIMKSKALEMVVKSKARTQKLQKKFVAIVIGKVVPMIIAAL